MTAAEWEQSTEPQQMLEALRESGRASERKFRLAWALKTHGSRSANVPVSGW